MVSLQALVDALAAVACISVGITLVGHILVWLSVRSPQRVAREEQAAAGCAGLQLDHVTLLKPLCGVDPSLEANLEGVALQSHANLAVVFGVSHPQDPAVGYARRFAARHPKLATRISLGETFGCINPKVALLDRMVVTQPTASAAGEAVKRWYVVSDSNVRLAPSYIGEALSLAQDQDVGLVTHLVAGCGGDSWAAYCENLQLNAGIAPAVCGVRFFTGRICVIGKSIFLRSDVLDRIGGFAAVGDVLAEDYVLGRAVQKAGFTARIANQPVRAWHEGWTFSRFFNRHGRWASMRRRISLTAYLLEPLLSPIPILVALLVARRWVSDPPFSAAWILAGVGVDMLLVLLTTWRLTGDWLEPAAWLINPVRELLTLMIWVKGWFVRKIEWRGKVYRISKGSALLPYETPVPSDAVWTRR